MISLKTIRNRIVAVEDYIKTPVAINLISTSGTCSTTNNLAGRPVTSYNCGGSCSWTCSGGCSRAAGHL